MEKLTFRHIAEQLTFADKRRRRQDESCESTEASLQIRPFQWARKPGKTKWFRQHIVHVDVSPETISIVHLIKTGNSYYPVFLSQFPLTEDKTPSDAGKFIQETVEPIANLNPRLWVTMQHPAINVVELMIPKISDEIDIETAIPLQLQSEVPEFNKDDYLWQYIEVGELEIEGIPYYHYLVAFSPKEIIEQYVKIFAGLSVHPEIMFSRQFIFLSGIEAVIRPLSNNLIIEVGNKVTTLFVYQNGQAVKIHEVPVGTQTFKHQRSQFSIPFEDSDLPVESSLRSRFQAAKKNLENTRIYPYHHLVAEIHKVRYWLKQTIGDDAFQAFFINFKADEDVELIQCLQTIFNIPVLPIIASESDLGAEFNHAFPFVGFPCYLRKNPGLVPREVVWEERLKKTNLGLVAIFMAIFSGMMMYHMHQQKHIKSLQAEINKLQNTVIQLGEKNETLRELMIRKSVLRKEVRFLQNILNVPEDALNYLYAITQNIPQSFQLTDVVYESLTHPVFMEFLSGREDKQGEYGILIKGYSNSPVVSAETQLLKYMDVLKTNVPYKIIKPVERNYNVQRQRYEFTLFMVVK